MAFLLLLRSRWLLRWLLFLLLWVLFSALILLIYYDHQQPFGPQGVATMLVTALCGPPAWYATTRLVPGMLYRRRIGAFVGSCLLLAIVNSALTYFIAGYPYHLVTGKPMFTTVLYFVYMNGMFFIANTIVITLSCAVKVIADRFRLEARLQTVEEEQIRTELAFLRAQVNPHFLFNVLNTIYFQIRKDNAEARSSVEKLSRLLRYQLYECTSDKLPVTRELAYIRNYVALQQLRLEPGTDVEISIQEDMGDFQIAPLLLLPLVENAFKHISHFRHPADNKLHISLHTEERRWLVARVENTFDDTHPVRHLVPAGGLGLQNVRRRLELLYPGTHMLLITKVDHTFSITLKICYDDQLSGCG